MLTGKTLNYVSLLNSLVKGWVAEYKFHPTRRWRADFANPTLKIIIEIEGGVFKGIGGGHNRGAGYRKDLEKYNAATILGYRLLRYLPEQMKSGKFVTDLMQILDSERMC